jgi:hypothetical protein
MVTFQEVFPPKYFVVCIFSHPVYIPRKS